MRHSVIHLKEIFPVLGHADCDPTLTYYLHDEILALGRTEQLRPGVLICPGGGYTDISERESEIIALQFLHKGYQAFVLRYSCAPNRFPTQLREVAGSMELIFQNGKQWNTDFERIAILGFSAGGHLAAHYSNCYDCPQVREVFPDSRPVKVSILCYPVISAYLENPHLGTFLNLSGLNEVTTEIAEQFSVERKVTSSTPPAFIWHTASDDGVDVTNSLVYAQALAKHKIPFALHIFPYGVHGLSTADDQTNIQLDPRAEYAADWLASVYKWLKLSL